MFYSIIENPMNSTPIVLEALFSGLSEVFMRLTSEHYKSLRPGKNSAARDPST